MEIRPHVLSRQQACEGAQGLARSGANHGMALRARSRVLSCVEDVELETMDAPNHGMAERAEPGRADRPVSVSLRLFLFLSLFLFLFAGGRGGRPVFKILSDAMWLPPPYTGVCVCVCVCVCVWQTCGIRARECSRMQAFMRLPRGLHHQILMCVRAARACVRVRA